MPATIRQRSFVNRHSSSVVRQWLLAVPLCLSFALAGGATGPDPGRTALPERLSDTRYRIGLVVLDQARRTASFPAVVNLREGLVEYAIVTTRGKIHESVFRTAADPRDLHLALLLLGIQPALTNAFPDDLHLPPPGQPVRLEIRWTRGPHHFKRPLEACIQSRTTGKPLAPGPWSYNGSFLHQGQLAAETTGSLVAIQIDPAALVNNPRPGREDDTLHFSNPRALPPPETLVQITVRI